MIEPYHSDAAQRSRGHRSQIRHMGGILASSYSVFCCSAVVWCSACSAIDVQKKGVIEKRADIINHSTEKSGRNTQPVTLESGEWGPRPRGLGAAWRARGQRRREPLTRGERAPLWQPPPLAGPPGPCDSRHVGAHSPCLACLSCLAACRLLRRNSISIVDYYCWLKTHHLLASYTILRSAQFNCDGLLAMTKYVNHSNVELQY